MGDANLIISNRGMKLKQSICRTGAFSLLELLCVMFIIGLLAALILPTLNRGKDRAKRIECEHNLHQLGIAFQSFVHDHGDKFPMAACEAMGGSQEFVQNGYAAGGEFYFCYRHFQPLASELSSPAVLICSTDTRLPATDFASLQNSNLSYFVGVKAAYDNPNSVLAGDRNLIANSMPNPSILRSAVDNRLWWTLELHRFKGDFLFADGRTEEWNNSALGNGVGTLAGADFFLPTVPFVPGSPTNPGYNTSAGQVAYRPMASPSRDARQSPPAGARAYATNSPSAAASAGSVSLMDKTELVALEKNQRLAKTLRHILIGFYSLISLILVLWLLARRRRRAQPESVPPADEV
jgi:prepilin-type N-terminal cleavage/methylation domain-containing protein